MRKWQELRPIIPKIHDSVARIEVLGRGKIKRELGETIVSGIVADRSNNMRTHNPPPSKQRYGDIVADHSNNCYRQWYESRPQQG